MMKPISLKAAYHIFPHFIRCIQNQELKEALDDEFLIALKKLKSKSDSILIQSKNYSDFFDQFNSEI